MLIQKGHCVLLQNKNVIFFLLLTCSINVYQKNGLELTIYFVVTFAVTYVITFDGTIVYNKNNNQKPINQTQCHKTTMPSIKMFTATNEPKTIKAKTNPKI